ncbi:MAG: TMEM175 family protein [Candidatus Eisenbacteria bacterium]
MIREKLLHVRLRGDHEFRWRGGDVSRLEGLSDAVFAFAITLLVVSLDVPRSFGELVAAMRGFVAFGLCFTLLVYIWYCHYSFFRRYGLEDPVTVALNGVLLFTVLFYIYPLKFLYVFLARSYFGVDSSARSVIQNEQMDDLLVIYGAGFLAIFVCFGVLHLYALRKRELLQLDELEVHHTRTSVAFHFIQAAIAAISIGIVSFGGPKASPIAGVFYAVIGPVLGVHGVIRHRGARRYRELPHVRARLAEAGVAEET